MKKQVCLKMKMKKISHRYDINRLMPRQTKPNQIKTIYFYMIYKVVINL